MDNTSAAGPLADRVLRLADGRRLAWAEWGRRDGPAVLLLHRSPGSRLFDPDPAATNAAGIRLLTFDRPGYGGTDPVSDPTRATVAADVKALADALGLEQVALAGWSGGGQFALDAAVLLGQRVRSLSLLATPAPDEDVPWVPDEFRPTIEAARANPVAALPSVVDACRWYADDPDLVVASDPGPADAAVRERPGVVEALTVMLREGARQGPGGMAFDIVAGSRDDPLPVAAIQQPTHLWYGEGDLLVGPAHGRWYAERLADATLTMLPDAGHLLPLTHWAAILDAALH